MAHSNDIFQYRHITLGISCEGDQYRLLLSELLAQPHRSGRAMIRTRIGRHVAGYAFPVALNVRSWEPASNVQQCDRLLASFWKHVGTDDYDYSPGYEVAAEESWIGPCCIALFSGDFLTVHR